MQHAQKIAHVPSKEKAPFSQKMQQALASLRLEGIELPSEALDDLHSYDLGQISKEELIKRVINRAKSKSTG